jgi:hypothetical protein
LKFSLSKKTTIENEIFDKYLFTYYQLYYVFPHLVLYLVKLTNRQFLAAQSNVYERMRFSKTGVRVDYGDMVLREQLTKKKC